MGNSKIGIRREDKNEWEGRVPLVPADIRRLSGGDGIGFTVQPSTIRAFSDDDFTGPGVEVKEDLRDCPVVVAVKEIPEDLLLPGRAYVYFSHTIKGQPENMPMLRRLMKLGCTLIDYERIVDEAGRRLIFFGRYAGLAGMIDTLWTAGRRFATEGFSTPLSGIRQAMEYTDLEAAKKAVSGAGEKIDAHGFQEPLTPFVIGVTGYGQVSKGAQEIIDLLPVREIAARELPALHARDDLSANVVYKVVFTEEDMVRPVDPDRPFDLNEYFTQPERYTSRFDKYLPFVTLLVNCIYWDERYPIFVPDSYLKDNPGIPLRVIGDITCDVEGSIQCNRKSTDSGNPVYVFDPVAGSIRDGVQGNGIVVLAVDNLPCEIPLDSSSTFSSVLSGFIPALAAEDFSAPFEKSTLPGPLKRAVIVYNGELTPDYKYISEFI